MAHDEETIAEMLPEPEDGHRLAVEDEDGAFTVIWRDDAAAKRWDASPGDRWFDDASNDPMSLYEHLKYARTVRELGPIILNFETDQ